MRICEYGCEKEAKYQFKNGKWCCSEFFSKCSKIREKNSKGNIGKKFKQSEPKKYNGNNKKCEYGCGKESKYYFDVSNKYCCSLHYRKCDNVRKKLSNSFINNPMYGGKIGKDNPFYGKTHTKETREKIRKHRTGFKTSEKTKINKKVTIDYIKEKYSTFYKSEKMRYDPDNPDKRIIQVHCKNHKCPNSKEQNGWFTPTGYQFEDRRRALENLNGNDAAYFYCSDKCKQECPLYNKRVSQLIKAGIIKEEYYTSQEYQTWRGEVLKRSNNLCEYCGQKAEHCHHIEPQKLEPYLSLDPDNGLACCSICHYKYGHKDECSTGKLAHTICK